MLGAAAFAQVSAVDGLIAPEERAWFDTLDAGRRESLLARARVAQACPAVFDVKDGVADARRAVRRGDVRLWSAWSYGTVVDRRVIGMDACQAPSGDQRPRPRAFRDLSQADAGQGLLMIENACSRSARVYAAQYNRELARLRPEAFRAACPNGRFTPRRQPAARP